MKAAALFLVLTCCALPALSLDGNRKRPKPAATVDPAQEFSASVTTTAAPTNKTTTALTTTTAAPTNKTTTALTTTTAAPTNKTTTATTITTTTPTPTTPSSLAVGNYSLKNGSDTCLMAQMAVQIRLQTAKTTFKVQPGKTQAVGGCNTTTANLTLSFSEGTITFLFNQSTADKTVYVNQVSFNISYNFKSLKANGRYVATNGSLHLFSAKVGHSYSCKNESVYMGNDLYLDVSQNRMQAFNLTANKEFGPPDVCEHDKPNYSVAIGVGVALLVLIVIVVVVYIVSRRRRSDGYQSL